MSEPEAQQSGSLGKVRPFDVLHRMVLEEASGLVRFESPLGVGTIWVRQGEIIDAELANVSGLTAVQCIIGLSRGTFYVQRGAVRRKRKVEIPTWELIAPSSTRTLEWSHLIQRSPSLLSVVAPTGKKLPASSNISPEDLELVELAMQGRSVLEVVDGSSLDPIQALRRLLSLIEYQVLVVVGSQDGSEDAKGSDPPPTHRYSVRSPDIVGSVLVSSSRPPPAKRSINPPAEDRRSKPPIPKLRKLTEPREQPAQTVSRPDKRSDSPPPTTSRYPLAGSFGAASTRPQSKRVPTTQLVGTDEEMGAPVKAQRILAVETNNSHRVRTLAIGTPIMLPPPPDEESKQAGASSYPPPKVISDPPRESQLAETSHPAVAIIDEPIPNPPAAAYAAAGRDTSRPPAASHTPPPAQSSTSKQVPASSRPSLEPAKRMYPNLPAAERLTLYDRQSSAPLVRLGKWNYRFAILVAPCAAAGAFYVAMQRQLAPLFAPGVLLLLIALGSQLVLINKMWKAIQDGRASVTPRRAVALLAIPVWNIYWWFRVMGGYAAEYNAFLERHQIPARPLSRHVILAALVLPVVGWFIYWVVIGRICDGVNAITQHFLGPSGAPRSAK